MELKGSKINFLGDSITAGSGTSSPEKKFSMLIEKYVAALENIAATYQRAENTNLGTASSRNYN